MKDVEKHPEFARVTLPPFTLLGTGRRREGFDGSGLVCSDTGSRVS